MDESALQGKEQEIYQAVCTCIDSLASYQAVRPLSHPGEFTRELQQALSALSFHEAEAAPQGVIFTDVQRARGLSFNTEKTRIIPPGEPFDLLGFSITGQVYDIAESSMEKIEWKVRSLWKQIIWRNKSNNRSFYTKIERWWI